ncbi:MAG: hypothetical protein ABI432_19375 [Flavobacteriales bacterium]
MPNTVIHRFIELALFAIAVGWAAPAYSSTAEDSASFALGSESSLVERARAMTGFANRALANDPTGALSHARNALLAAEQSGDLTAEHEAMRAKCAAQMRLGLHAEFLQTTISALQVAQVIGDPAFIAMDLQSLSLAYEVNMQPDKAVEEARNALAIVVPTKVDRNIDQAYRFLIQALLRAARYDEALRIGQKASERTIERADPVDEARISHLIAEIMLAQNKPSDAMPFLAKAERVLNEQGTDEERSMLRLDRAKALIAIGEYNDASALLDDAEDHATSAGSGAQRSMIGQLRYELALAGHDWHTALGLLQSLKQQSDSLQEAQVGLKMAGLQVMYQVERKEQDNSLKTSSSLWPKRSCPCPAPSSPSTTSTSHRSMKCRRCTKL